ncbi:MAG: hypothetical protein COA79_02440 [Planctomycetota bacterium]|nr:MAG: hypothetical protein COA79_02440 [Planctomycetota bacterium]
MNNLSTQDLIDSIRDGSDEATNELIKIHIDRVYAIVRLRLGRSLRNHMDSGDLVQESMLRVVGDLYKFKYQGEGSFIRWVAAIVENEIRNKAKFFNREKRKPSEIKDDSPGFHPLNSPSQTLILKEDKFMLEKAINVLPENYKEVILQRKYECLKFKEIAINLSLSEDGCRMLYGRAMVSLTKEFMRLNDKYDS